MPTGKRPKNCYERKNSPFWYYDFLLDGERRCGSTECEDAKSAAAFVEALKVGARQKPSPVSVSTGPKPQITLAAAFELYETGPGLKIVNFKQMQHQHDWLLLIGADKNLSEITHQDVLDYARRRRKAVTRLNKPMSAASVNREIAQLQAVYGAMRREYDIGDPPVWKSIKDSKSEVERVRELKQSEWERLHAALQKNAPDLIHLVEFAILSGMRQAAIVTLTWDQVDFANRQIEINLKGGRRHVVPISHGMKTLLDGLPRVEGCTRVFTYQPKAKLFEITAPGRREYSATGWGKVWRESLTLARVEDFRFHDLRHTAATRIIRKTGNLKIAQNLLGHRSIATTARYAHAFTDDIREAMDTVGEMKVPVQDTPDFANNIIPIRR